MSSLQSFSTLIRGGKLEFKLPRLLINVIA
jgi:hypothetical protein